MKKIKYKKVPYSKIDESFLNGYIRFQETTEVLYFDEGTLRQKKDSFRNDWNQKELMELSLYFRKLVKKGYTLYAGFAKKLVVGFIIVGNNIFYDEYVNVPYVHTCRGYRGFGIGRYLFLLGAIDAIRKGAKKFYISTHPAIETQAFYQKVGCVLTKKINPDLLALEPLDIQYEYVLDYKKVVLELLQLEMKRTEKLNAQTVAKITSSMYQYMPSDDLLYMEVCKELIISNTRASYSLGTSLLKKRSSVIKKENMDFFVDILLNHIHGWGQVDQYCYRVMNPMIELDEEYYTYLLKWSDSDNKDVRRASLVSMLRSTGKITLEYDYDRMIHLVDKLKDDEDFHVRKAVGWVLKCAFVTYPKQIETYLRDNVHSLDRMIFRYALEHVENPLRQELMEL